MKRKGGLGWLPAWLSRGVETQEEIFWRGLPLEGLMIYDVGAFHGILTLFFATRGARVIAYEPNDPNHARLIENINLNRLTNVQVRKFGVGAALGVGTLHYNPEMAGGGTLNTNGIATMSQSVRITTLDHDIAAASLPAHAEYANLGPREPVAQCSSCGGRDQAGLGTAARNLRTAPAVISGCCDWG